MDNKTCYITKYLNNAHLKITYFREPDPKFPYEDRFELELRTPNKETIGYRMTFAEAMTIIQHLTSALNDFVDDVGKPGFDVPLRAGVRIET